MRQSKETRVEIDKLVREYAAFEPETPTDFVSFRNACTLAREIKRLRRQLAAARSRIAKRNRHDNYNRTLAGGR